MRKLLQVIPIVLFFAGATLLFERPAYAYADPGTGLLAIQAVGSALVASGWYLRKKIRALLYRSGNAKYEPVQLPAVTEDEESPLR
ncbi:MAG: hypothetical protein WCA11_10305 [Terracidiphilus sp.]